MSKPARSIMIAGYPFAGKSTYLAAFWHIVTQDMNSPLRVERFSGAQPYLHSLEQDWLQCKELQRTLVSEHDRVYVDGLKAISMMHGDSEINLIIPDVSGEIFSNMWELREIPEQVAEHMQKITGAILFINPLDYRSPVRIEEEAEASADLGVSAQSAAESSSASARQWHPKSAATAPKLVELLQVLMSKRGAGAPIRLSVVISAWDAVGARYSTPQSWIDRRSPLLAQFLRRNSEALDVRTFGVSAQGGDYKKPEALGPLQATIDPRERVIIHDGSSETHEICLPMLWAIGV